MCDYSCSLMITCVDYRETHYSLPLYFLVWGNRTIFYVIDITIHGCLEIGNLFLVLNRISHSFTLLTHEPISCLNTRSKCHISTYPCNVLFSIYYSSKCADKGFFEFSLIVLHTEQIKVDRIIVYHIVSKHRVR